MRSRLQPLDDHLRDQNTERRERLQGKESPSPPVPALSVVVAPTPDTDHAAVIADFRARYLAKPSWYWHVPTGRFAVRYRYRPDRWLQVHRSATAEDRERWMQDFLSPTAVDVQMFEVAA